MSSFNNGYVGEQSSSDMTNDPRRNDNPPAMQSIVSTQVTHQPDLWEIINEIVGPTQARAGDQGDHTKKPRAKVRWEGLNMFGWVDGAWSMLVFLEYTQTIATDVLAERAAYHIAVRERLILKDAEQPGAPGKQSQSIRLGPG